jgi:S-methylmethionine-dependent homocysteine/selenocysteine methylase
MSATYDLSTTTGRVRLAVNDKNLTAVVFTDEEIASFLADNSNSVNLAGAALLESWAASYGANADSEHIGDYSYTQKIVTNMLTLAKNLREKESNIPAVGIAEPDLLQYGKVNNGNDENATSWGVYP